MHNLEHHRHAVRSRLRRSDVERAGPGSVTWTVNREIIVVAGWGRAILLQLAHPSVAAGVHHHSAFRGSLRASWFHPWFASAPALAARLFGGAPLFAKEAR